MTRGHVGRSVYYVFVDDEGSSLERQPASTWLMGGRAAISLEDFVMQCYSRECYLFSSMDVRV